MNNIVYMKPSFSAMRKERSNGLVDQWHVWSWNGNFHSWFFLRTSADLVTLPSGAKWQPL